MTAARQAPRRNQPKARTRPFELMLAGKITDAEKQLPFPGIYSPKIDGVRAGVIAGNLRSRKLISFDNRALQAAYSITQLTGIDGEFTLGEPYGEDLLRRTSAAVRTMAGQAHSLTFWAFDCFNEPGQPFIKRYDQLRRMVENSPEHLDIRLVPQKLVKTYDEFLALEEKWLGKGYEGIMGRRANGPYKYGRSTLGEGYLLKVKRFEDAEARVIGVEEEMYNGNEAVVSELGRTKRSSHKANKSGKGMMGKLRMVGVNGDFEGVEFRVGTGFSLKDRAQMWADHTGEAVTYNQDGIEYTVVPSGRPMLGRIYTYTYFAHGVLDKPRHSVIKTERFDL